MTIRRAIAATALTIALTACSPIVSYHGYTPTDDDVALIELGVDTTDSVSRKIGRPATGGIVGGTAWYYVSSRFETMAYNEPEIVERDVVVVSFDEAGFVDGVEKFGLENGRVINLVTRTTPTYGRRMTILEQLFANVGNITANSVNQ